MISIVIPVYNEKRNLQSLYPEITRVMKSLTYDYELVFVDDGSTDKSFDVLSEIQQNDKKVKIIRLRRNFGKSAVYSAGFHHAKGEIIITMDADLQDDPNEIPLFIDKINEGYDIVIGWKHRGKGSLDKTIPSKIFNKVVSYVTGIPLHDFNCPFKAYRREVLQELDIHGKLHRFIPVLAISRGFSFAEIKIKNLPRRHGESNFGIERYHQGMLDLLTVLFLTRFAKRPLHLPGMAGLISCLTGSFILFVLVGAHFLHIAGLLPNPAWNIHDRPLLSLGILLIIVGIQCFSIGLLGELFINVIGSPGNNSEYSIRQILDE
ncbi:MAG: glycosyltransferase family 2 protein [Desulfobacteraceae bacterium]|nr:glycosyltransferase family 2 protein [Desulfobacteraceae bacterium]